MTATLLALVFARLLAAPVPQVAETGVTLTCAGLSARELHARGRHLFLCANLLTGELLGAVVRRSGVWDCALSGVVDLETRCYVLNGCGAPATGCL